MGADNTSVVRSVQGGRVRLTEERWNHVIDGHGELVGLRDAVLETLSHPRRVLAGREDARMAIREIEAGKWLVVVYREFNGVGFVVTAFLTRRQGSLSRREQLWPIA